MADLEQFGGSEQQEELDQAAVERLRERLKAGAAQIKAAKKQEGKQQKKEDRLAKIISRYLQGDDKKEFLLLVLRCLEQNIPPVFILGMIALVEKDIEEETSHLLKESREETGQEHPAPPVASAVLAKIGVGEDALPLKAKVEIDLWLETLSEIAEEKGHIMLETLKDPDDEIKVVAIQLTAFVLREFLASQKLDADYRKLQAFAGFILTGICKKIEGRGKLGEGED